MTACSFRKIAAPMTVCACFPLSVRAVHSPEQAGEMLGVDARHLPDRVARSFALIHLGVEGDADRHQAPSANESRLLDPRPLPESPASPSGPRSTARLRCD